MSRRLAVLAVAAVIAVTGCGHGHGHAAAHRAAAARPAALSLLAQCQLLRADVLANGGSPDRPTLARIAAQPHASVLRADAARAERDTGQDNTVAMDMQLAMMAYDCRAAGVKIPDGS